MSEKTGHRHVVSVQLIRSDINGVYYDYLVRCTCGAERYSPDGEWVTP